jgi:hypothetical protein
MKKTKGLLIMPIIIIIVVTFFGSFAFAAKVTRVNKEKGYVFVDDGKISGLIMGTEKCFFLPSGEQLVDRIVQEISASESVVSKNRELLGSGRRKRKSREKRHRKHGDKQEIIQDDYIRQEQERIEEEEEERIEEEERKREQERIEEEEERKREQERIKKEDWFR